MQGMVDVFLTHAHEIVKPFGMRRPIVGAQGVLVGCESAAKTGTIGDVDRGNP
jgi:hypothetical protein